MKSNTKKIIKEQSNKELKINSKLGNSEDFSFGSRTQESFISDPKHLLFNLARYKFVSKIFSQYKNVLEIGCGDGFGSSLVAQTTGRLTATDLDILFINESQKKHPLKNKIIFKQVNLLKNYVDGNFDGAFCLDVLEHIPVSLEDVFITNIVKSLNPKGDLIVGMPSLESQKYASKISKQGHVNCKTGLDLKKTMEKYFSKIFMFSMNDEVLHTGFFPMSHYLLALCIEKK
ncbi:class I SAM-dependent methyltransferase [bacterium]|nr:class I SAM-dependent methyltransferase [bacterium]